MTTSRSNGDGKGLVDGVAQTFTDREEKYKKLLGPLFRDGGTVQMKKCPVCGSGERIFDVIGEYMIQTGKLKPDSMLCSQSFTQIIHDPTGVQLIGSKCPAFTILEDICRRCGNEYPKLIMRKDVKLDDVKAGGKVV